MFFTVVSLLKRNGGKTKNLKFRTNMMVAYYARSVGDIHAMSA